MAASQSYSVYLTGTNDHYLDVYVSRTIDTVSYEVYYRVANASSYYNYNSGNKLQVWFNDRYYVDTANVCAININGAGSQLIASGSFAYSATNLWVWVHFDQTQRTGNDGTIDTTFSAYKVTYHGNGGLYNGSSTWVDSIRSPVCIGQSYTTYGNFFTRNGYAFTGWKDQNGNDWTSSINVPWTWNANYAYDITLYAQWIANEYKYTLTFNPNGGALKNPGGNLNNGTNSNSVTVTYGSGNYNLMYNDIPTRDGYVFLGWYTPASDGTQIYNSSGNYVNNGTYWSNGKWNYHGNVTVYAQWAKEHTLSYDANGGIGDSYEQKVIAGQTITIDENTFTHETDKYTGWYLKRNDDTWYTTSNIWATEEEISENGYNKMLYVSGQSLIISSSWIVSDETSFSLCVAWESGNTVIFYPNNKTGEVTRFICFEGEDFVIPSDVPTLDKHTFIYWTTASDGTGDIYYPNDVVFIDEENPPTFVETGLYAQYINFNVYVYPDGTIEAVGFVEDDNYQGIDGNGIVHMPQFIQHNINNVQLGSGGLYAFAFKNKQKHDSLT